MRPARKTEVVETPKEVGDSRMALAGPVEIVKPPLFSGRARRVLRLRRGLSLSFARRVGPRILAFPHLSRARGRGSVRHVHTC